MNEERRKKQEERRKKKEERRKKGERRKRKEERRKKKQERRKKKEERSLLSSFFFLLLSGTLAMNFEVSGLPKSMLFPLVL